MEDKKPNNSSANQNSLVNIMESIIISDAESRVINHHDNKVEDRFIPNLFE